MDNVFFLLVDDAADIFGKDFLHGQGDGVHDVVAKVLFHFLLAEPVVADEFAGAGFHVWVAVGFAALEFFDVLLVVVADEFTERGLLVELGLLPLRAVGVAHIVGAFVPGFEDGEGIFVVLHDHEASVSESAVEAVRVVLRFGGGPGVFGHDHGVVRFDVPVVEHPFDGDVEEAEGSIGVQKYDEFVILDVIRQCGGFDPRSVTVFKVAGVDKLVVVAVDKRIGVVVEDATRHMANVAPVVFALGVVLGGLQWTRFQVENQDFAAQLLCVMRIRRQLDVIAIGLPDEGRSWRYLQILVEQTQNFADGHVGLCVGVVSAIHVISNCSRTAPDANTEAPHAPAS